MAADPSIGRASASEARSATHEAELTRALYERHGRRIFAYCLHRLGSREEAEDATQTTFMNAFRGLRRGIVPELESAWLFKIANNVILTRRRSASRRRRVETPGDLDAIQDLLPSREPDADELIRLTEALSAMPDGQRHALLLREWQGLSYREIGEELDLSQAAVETLLFRARRSLAQGLTAPTERRRARGLRGGLDLGSLLAGLKGLLGGSVAVKAVATAAVVAGSAVVATDPVLHHRPARPLPASTRPASPAPARRHLAPARPAAETSVPEVASPVRAVGRPPRASRHAHQAAARRPARAAPPRAANPRASRGHTQKPVHVQRVAAPAAAAHEHGHAGRGRDTARTHAATPPAPVRSAPAESPPAGPGKGLGNGHGRGNPHVSPPTPTPAPPAAPSGRPSTPAPAPAAPPGESHGRGGGHGHR